MKVFQMVLLSTVCLFASAVEVDKYNQDATDYYYCNWECRAESGKRFGECYDNCVKTHKSEQYEYGKKRFTW